MAKMKVYDIAKSINMKSTELVKALNDNGFEVKSHNSNIEDEAIAFIIKNIAPKTVPGKETKEVEKDKKEEERNKQERITEEIKANIVNQEDTKGKKEEVGKVAEAPAMEDRKAETSGKPVGENRTTEEKELKTAEKASPNVEEKAAGQPKGSETGQKTELTGNHQTAGNREGSQENRRNDGRSQQDNRNQNDRPVQNRNAGGQNRRPSDRGTGNRPDSRSGGYGERNGQPRGGSHPDGRSTGYSSNNGDRNNTQRTGSTGSQNYGQRNNGTGSQSYAQRNNTNGGSGYGQRNNGTGDRSYGQRNTGSGTGGQSYGQRNNGTGSQSYGQRNNGTGGQSYAQRNNTNGSSYGQRNTGNGSGGQSYAQRNNANGDRSYGQRSGSNGDYNNAQRNSSNNNRPFNRNNSNGNNRPADNRRNGTNGQNSRPGNNSQQRTYGNRGGRGDFVDKAMSSMDTPVFENKDTKRKDNNKGKRVDRNIRTNGKKYRENDITELRAKKDPNRKGAFQKPEPVAAQPDDGIKTIQLAESLTIRELADKMKQPAAALVKKLFLAGKMYSINQEITFEEAEEIALEYNIIAEQEETVDVIEELLKEDEEDTDLMEKRPPVVCVMGHVDHGKTSLLDAIRETRVTEREAGGITQHIGAYMVEANEEMITFLDTPGHEAFTSMRMRGAKSTDIAILVVAADDGVMPQTIEAINHAKAADVEIIVAINKIDKPGANIERVKQELSEYELIPEDWGGHTVFVPVSAKTMEGIEQLLEMIILTAEVLELKANKNRLARGIVIEAQLDKGRGPVATVLVQKGTLTVGDAVVIGSAHGKIRAMMDDKGRRVKEATPSTPVEILGLNEVPDAGEVFMAMESEKEAKSVASAYITQGKEKLLADTKAKLSLDGLFSQIKAGNIKELNLIVKADVQGSVEAVKQSLLKLSNEEVAIRIIHGGVGAINESDVSLAIASNAIIIGFNVRPDPTAKETSEREKVDLRLYKVIYNAIEDIEAAMKGMLDPVFEEKVIGHAEIRQIFKASKVGNIAGSYVLDGKIIRDSMVRITREGNQVFEGKLASLKRFKDDVKEVATGYECGLVFEDFDVFQEEDKVEAYIMQEVPR